jgi:hypothetical protein
MEYGRIEADRLGKHSPEVPAFLIYREELT